VIGREAVRWLFTEGYAEELEAPRALGDERTRWGAGDDLKTIRFRVVSAPLPPVHAVGKAKTYAERDLATFVRCLVTIGADPRIERTRGYGDELIFTWRDG
jgi:hypothetical protein